MARNDKFANIAAIKHTVESNTLEFTELLSGVSLGSKIGMMIDQIDYYIDSACLEDFTDAESLTMALTVSNSIDDLDVEQKAVIHRTELMRIDFGTAASAQFIAMPMTYQFLPPIIVAAPRMYLGALGSEGITGTIRARIFYRYIDLTSQEYLELAESFVLVG